MAVLAHAALRSGHLAGGPETDRAALRANGFYQAEIVKERGPSRSRPTASRSRCRSARGSRPHVGKLEVDGLEGLPPADRAAVIKRLPLAPGAVFKEEDWAATKRLLTDRLRNHGYYKASVEGKALVDVGTQRADLTLVVDPGRRYFFGDVEVDTVPGARVPGTVVWEQVRLAIKEGEAFNDKAVEEAQRRVFGLGVFTTIRVVAGEPDETTARIPVRVVVREGPFRTLRLGVGARADAIRNEVRGVAEWTNRDFLGGTRRLTARAEAGWAFLPSVWAVLNNDVDLRAAQRPDRAHPLRVRAAAVPRPPVAARAQLARDRSHPRADVQRVQHAGDDWRRLAGLVDAGDLPRLPDRGRLPERRANQQRRDRAADARMRDHHRPLLRLAVVPGSADHLGPARPRVRPAQRYLRQPVVAGGGRTAGRRLRLRARAARRARLPQLRRGRGADAVGAPARRASCGRPRATPTTARSSRASTRAAACRCAASRIGACRRCCWCRRRRARRTRRTRCRSAATG